MHFGCHMCDTTEFSVVVPLSDPLTYTYRQPRINGALG